MKKIILPAILTAALLATSCTKDELQNTECDIRKAVIHLPRPQDYFVNLTDTTALVHQSFSSSEIVFKGINVNANLNGVTPTFTISTGAVLFPQQGTRRDFSNAQKQPYYVIAEDTKGRYPLPDYNDKQAMAAFQQTLDQAILRGEHIRRYEVQFISLCVEMADVVEYNFNTYYLEEPKHRFYQWSDLFEGKQRAIPNWATANEGFCTARSSALPEEYPTVPVSNGGIDGGSYVRLTTCNTGSLGEMTGKPLAAGNLFLGTFDFSKALTVTLEATRFGENSILGRKPKTFSGYYRYTPGTLFTDVHGNPLAKEDRPAIYCVVYINKDADGKPYVLNGETIDQPNNPYIVGRAEITQWQINTTQWVPFELGFEWYQQIKPDLLATHGYNFAIVCSSSKDGATYSGAVGSTLLVDNLKIIMEK